MHIVALASVIAGLEKNNFRVAVIFAQAASEDAARETTAHYGVIICRSRAHRL